MYCTACGCVRIPANTDRALGLCLCGNSAWVSWRPPPFAWPPNATFGAVE